MTKVRLWAAPLLALWAAVSQSGLEPHTARVLARVVDAASGSAIPEAMITTGATVVRADVQGRFTAEATEGSAVHVRAPGYLRGDVPERSLHGPDATIRLTPFRPKALYLTAYGVGDKPIRTAALALLKGTALNALVIDVKGDRGIVPYRSTVPLATAVGAQHVITIPDLPGLVRNLRDQAIYTIARVVVFEDNLLAEARPDLAVRTRDGAVYRDRENLAWANPYSRDVWSYNVAIAAEAANAGFDEIQFDYVRLPDASGLAYERPWTEENRESAVDGFLETARSALVRYNVFLSADVFGYVCWNPDDTKIGQKLEHVAGLVDYVSPMLYPSAFQAGIPGYRIPLDHPYDIVRLSLDEAQRRTAHPPLRFRPWLQAFPDYAFDKRSFTGEAVRKQIAAAEDFGADGWMLWNPHNSYAASDVTPNR